MHRHGVLSALALVGVSMLAGSRPTLATTVEVGAGRRAHDDVDECDDPDEETEEDAACERVTTTGQTVARGSWAGTRSNASVDTRLTAPIPRSTLREHERPIDRLRSRGEGRTHATGDKGARRELREKARRHI